MINKNNVTTPKTLTVFSSTAIHPLDHAKCCACFIVPAHILEKFAKDKKLTPAQRKSFANAAKVEALWRKSRIAETKHTLMARSVLPMGMTSLAATIPPEIAVFDCQHGTALPGNPVNNAPESKDATAQRAFLETKAVADFYNQVFGRNSLDGNGMGLLSSIHYSVDYNNAFWNGRQMTYGDGDGNIFIDFTNSNDVIAHELTHGVTQFTAGLGYSNQAGGLNESMSDVFGTMFRQWRAEQDVTSADWLIGKDIMGPGAIERGFTCLRDMSNPASDHCLAPQPTHFAQYQDGMDPHESSGIPNLAFYKAAMEIGGNSWDKAGQIWYHVLVDYAPNPYMKMDLFANRTRKLANIIFPSEPSVEIAIDNAWKAVGL